MRSLEDLAIEGRRLFVRVDFNVPLTRSRKVADDTRIRAVLPTIKRCVERGARIVLASHLGRPKGVFTPELSLEPVAARLAELLNCDVILADEPVGDGARKVVSDLRDGQIAMLENLRFDPGETANDETFARGLAAYGDVYLTEAFGALHRAHASTAGMIPFVADCGAGPLVFREVEVLTRLHGEVDRPYIAVIGGAKVSDKIELLGTLLDRVDGLVIGGAMANTFLMAKGVAVGASRVERDRLAIARDLMRRANEAGVKIHLPTDVVVATSVEASAGTPRSLGEVQDDEMILDIGPGSAEAYAGELGRARTIFWNGPMGVFERVPFAAGTLAVAHAIAGNRWAFSVVGGGDSAAAISAAGDADRVGHVSTGGGATLEFIQGKVLPGLAALQR